VTAARSEALTGRLLLVEDDRPLRQMVAEFLVAAGHQVDEVAALDQAIARLRSRPYDVVLSDLVLERGHGLELLDAVREERFGCEVLIMTGHGDVATAVEAMRRGAYTFVTKPLDLTRLRIDVEKALEKRSLAASLARLQRAQEGREYGGLQACSPVMRGVISVLDRAAGSDSTVLILGPSGSGKELAARAVHEHSPRRAGPFVALHCGALAPELFEDELFGHAAGAFTGATAGRPGAFERADGGTLFLDEVAAAPARVQVALLRVLQERRVRPLGGEADRPVDVRVVAATNADLDAALAAGAFRRDLYYRLAAVVVRLPPLAERREDIPLLAASLLERAARRHGVQATLAPRALERLVEHDWPGNVRELAHVLERAVLLGRGGVIGASDLPLGPAEDEVPTLEQVEREHIRGVLARCAGNKLRAARLLGIPRASLYRKIARYGIDADEAARRPADRSPPRGGLQDARDH
jgi:DNA-binding NtrC family response regulator